MRGLIWPHAGCGDEDEGETEGQGRGGEMAVSPLLRFGPFTFEPHTGALWRETERLPLQPQDAAVLYLLLQQAGHVVRTEALLDAVWPRPTSARRS